MDILEYLKRDHRKVSKLFKQIIDAKSPKERKNLFLEVKREIELHSDPEHDTFYKALLRTRKGEEEVNHADEEHKEIKNALRKLARIPERNTVLWLVHFGELVEKVNHHVKDEEENLFSEAKASLSQEELTLLAEEMDAAKQKLIEEKYETA